MRTLIIAFLAAVFLILSRPVHTQTLEGPSAPQASFVLTIEDDLISLSAKDASLKAMIEEIGRRMNIPVKVEIPAVAKVTLAFERLPLPEVFKQLGRYVNYGYVESWEEGELRISGVTVPSLKVATPPSGPGLAASQPQEEERQEPPAPKALELEIDPTQYLRERRQ